MSLYRNITWFLKGMREYTASGFERASNYFNENDISPNNARNKVVMVTGGNSGIGYECALRLATLGSEVHLVCRNQDRGIKALDKIREACPENQKLFLHLADMSDLNSVAALGKKFSSTHSHLDVVILNAGAMINSYQINPDTKLELNFVTNTLGTYVMCQSLIPVLKNSRDPRVIVVSSGGMLVQKLIADDPSQTEYFFKNQSKFDSTMVYAQNKRQQVILVEEWSKKYKGIQFFSMHPGWASTPGVETAMPSFHYQMQNKLRTAAQGADTAIWLSVCPDLPQNANGAFFQDRVIVKKHLPLACTQSSEQDIDKFMDYLLRATSKYIDNTIENRQIT